ncbi:MAG: 4'-phosphopantetheinyl transferase superfamily protein [Acidobacteriota bacterium]
MSDLDRFSAPPSRPPRPAALTAGRIDIWRVDLNPPENQMASYRALLSPDERMRADRFHFDRHRRRYIVGRGALRRLLGQYLDQPAATLSFAYGPKDKPFLPDTTLQFNLTNSHELALIAITEEVELGVDVEHLRAMPDAEAVAERHFSASERRALRSVPSEAKELAFFRCWTRKEAYVKALGDGLSLPLDRFDVSLEEARFLALDGDPAKAAEWSLFHVNPGPGYVGAVAVPGRGWELRGWRWEPEEG